MSNIFKRTCCYLHWLFPHFLYLFVQGFLIKFKLRNNSITLAKTLDVNIKEEVCYNVSCKE